VVEVWAYSRPSGIARRGRFDPDRVPVIPLAVDADLFPPESPFGRAADGEAGEILSWAGPSPAKGSTYSSPLRPGAFTAADDVALVVKASAGTRSTPA